MPGVDIAACSSGRVTLSVIAARRQRPAVRDDDDARELERRVDAARQLPRGDEPRGDEQDGGENHRPRVMCGGGDEIHGATLTAAPSGRPSWPDVTTVSPAATPDRISAVSPDRAPIFTSRRAAFLPDTTKSA